MRECSVEDCSRSIYAKAMCKIHYDRVRMYGRVDRARKVYDSQTYDAQHRRLGRRYGYASNHDCAICGGTAQEWAFIKEFCPSDQIL